MNVGVILLSFVVVALAQETDFCAVNNGGCGKVFDKQGNYVPNYATSPADVQLCFNTATGPVCGQCPTDNFIRTTEGCQDVDECAGEGNGFRCQSGTACRNLVGGYECSQCPPGYEGTGKLGCSDINECLPDPISGKATSKCDENAQCINGPGFYECVCKVGYRGGGVVLASTAADIPDAAVACLDINECVEGLDIDPGDTDLNAEYPCNGQMTVCVNTPGSFECANVTCPCGFEPFYDKVWRRSTCEPYSPCERGGGSAVLCPSPKECKDVPCEGQDGFAVIGYSTYSCGGCPDGYIERGGSTVVRRQGTCTMSEVLAVGTDVDPAAALGVLFGTNPGCAECVSACSSAPDPTMCATACATADHIAESHGRGGACEDIDECSSMNGGCHPTANDCNNTIGSYECVPCPGGHRGAYAVGKPPGSGCFDIDECAEGLDNCNELVKCVNTVGSFTCTPCPDGFTGSGRGKNGCTNCPIGKYMKEPEYVCIDIDECADKTDNCTRGVGPDAEYCTNTDPWWFCTGCEEGYRMVRGDGNTTFDRCEDINECADPDLNDCHELASCRNLPGTYECFGCAEGYNGTGYGKFPPNEGCVDIDECKDPSMNACSELCIGIEDCTIDCINYPGGSIKVCPKDGTRTLPDGCSEHPALPLPRGYDCQKDVFGECPPGYKKNEKRTACIDINECEIPCEPGMNKTQCNSCDLLTSCVNIIGYDSPRPDAGCAFEDGVYKCGYYCTPCPDLNIRFEGNSYEQCKDIDECKADGAGCDPAPCLNTFGSFRCGECPPGYIKTPGTDRCVDINECERSYLNDCLSYTKCINTLGNYSCGACPPGYFGDGTRSGTGCQNVDECACFGANKDELMIRPECEFRSEANEGNLTQGAYDQFTNLHVYNQKDVLPCESNYMCTDCTGSYSCGEDPCIVKELPVDCGAYKVFSEQTNECISPCGTTNDPCQPPTKCEIVDETVSPDLFRCTPCPAGTERHDVFGCVDIDECLDPAACAPGTACENFDGGFRCSTQATSTVNSDLCADNVGQLKVSCSPVTMPVGQVGPVRCNENPDSLSSIESYQWNQDSGAALDMSMRSSALQLPASAPAGVYTFSLSVVDNCGETAGSNLVVTITEDTLAPIGRDETRSPAATRTPPSPGSFAPIEVSVPRVEKPLSAGSRLDLPFVLVLLSTTLLVICGR